MQLLDHIYITRHRFAVCRLVAMIIVIELLQQHDTASIGITKHRNRAVHTLLQASKTYYIAERLNRVKNTVGTRKRLYQAVHFQVFVHPQRIHCGRIKACQEHIHDNQQIKFLVFHTKRYIFIVILKLIARCIVIRMEHLVIVPDSLLQKIPRGLIECSSVLGILLIENSV